MPNDAMPASSSTPQHSTTEPQSKRRSHASAPGEARATEPGPSPDRDRRRGSARKQAHLTVTAEEFRAGKLCSCTACVRDGQHELDCAVHDEPRGDCTCGVAEQREAAS